MGADAIKNNSVYRYVYYKTQMLLFMKLWYIVFNVKNKMTILIKFTTQFHNLNATLL